MKMNLFISGHGVEAVTLAMKILAYEGLLVAGG